MEFAQEIKKAVAVGYQVILTLNDESVIRGYPERITDSKRVKVLTTEGQLWIPLEEIIHLTRIIPFGE